MTEPMSDGIQVTSEGWRFTMVPNGPMLDTSLSATQKSVFVALCTFLGNNGNTVWPSYKTIALRAGCSKRAAMTAINDALVKRGYVEKRRRRNEDGSQESNLFVIPKRAENVLTGESDAPGSEPAARGVVQELHGGSETAAPKGEPEKYNQQKENNTSASPHGAAKTAKEQPYQSDFEEWWRLYPRKKEKKRAYKQYAALRRKGVDKQSLLDAVKGYTEECRKDGREERFIKHAATFLGPAESWREYVENGDEISSKKAEEKLEMQRVKREISYDDYIARLKQLRGEVS